MTRIFNRWWIVVLVAGIAWLLWSGRQASIRDARRELASAQAEETSIRDRIARAREAISSNTDELSAQWDWESAATNRAAQLEEQISMAPPASRWAVPPADWPHWDTNSPYVWLRKDIFSELRIKRFNGQGEMSRDLADLLGLSRDEAAAVNSSLAQIVAAHQTAQLARIQRTESPPDSANGDRTLTVLVPPSPQDGAVQAQQFQAALQDQLGAQRAGLIGEDTNWFESEFDLNPTATNTYALTLRTNGQYSLRVAEGANGSSYYGGGGSANVLSPVPSYLRSAFSNFMQSL